MADLSGGDPSSNMHGRRCQGKPTFMLTGVHVSIPWRLFVVQDPSTANAYDGAGYRTAGASLAGASPGHVPAFQVSSDTYMLPVKHCAPAMRDRKTSSLKAMLLYIVRWTRLMLLPCSNVPCIEARAAAPDKCSKLVGILCLCVRWCRTR